METGVTEAATRGWEPISANFLLPEWVRSHWPKYVEGRARAGKVASPAEWRVAKSIFVCDDEATARRYGKSAEGPYHFYFRQLVRKLVGFGGRSNLFKSDQGIPDSVITPDYVTDKLVIAGTPESVVDQILAFREQVGDFGTLVYACHDWMDPALAKRSMALFANDAKGEEIFDIWQSVIMRTANTVNRSWNDEGTICEEALRIFEETLQAILYMPL